MMLKFYTIKSHVASKLIIYLLLISSLFQSKVIAGVGDTIIVQAHNTVHMNYHGNFDAWAVFPSDTFHFSKILMTYKLGCATTGCAAYDYTTQVFARRPSGVYDSTLTQYPSFTVGGIAVDSVVYNTHVTYNYFYNNFTMGLDSTVANQFQILLFNDSLNPAVANDSILVYPGNYFNYIYNAIGSLIDSVYVPYDSVWQVVFTNVYSTPIEVKDLIECGRVMTPFGGNLSAAWYNNYTFDVTDYKPLFHDSLEFRIFFDGWADGYRVSVTFYMIEGTPPRDVKRVRVLYPDDYYRYGFATDPIESHLVPVTLDMDSSEVSGSVRVIPSGHSFGGAQNCAEFCNKSYKVLVNDTIRYTQPVWRSDCGMNPVWHQGGTWIYDRSNWCPGMKALTKEHELTPYIHGNDSIKLDLNFDSYTYTGGAGFDPGYILSANVITYGAPNFAIDASMDEIISPNNDLNYARFNPICNNPQIVIRNLGSTPLTSCSITYGIKGGVQQTYNWTGNLNFLERNAVQLGTIAWGSAAGTPDDFEAIISNPNGGVDQNIFNNTMQSKVAFTPMLPSQFKLQWKTNNATNETSYKVFDDQGVLLYQNQVPLVANTVYNDTISLTSGCYLLRIDDSGKDGLSFFANNDGTGYIRLMQANGTATIIKTFESDFGTQINYYFTVGFTTTVSEQSVEQPLVNLFPNPAHEKLNINVVLPKQGDMKLILTAIDGRIVIEKNFTNFNQELIEVDLSNQATGMYFLSVQTNGYRVIKKLVKE